MFCGLVKFQSHVFYLLGYERVSNDDASDPHDFTGEPNSFEEFRLSLSNLWWGISPIKKWYTDYTEYRVDKNTIQGSGNVWNYSGKNKDQKISEKKIGILNSSKKRTKREKKLAWELLG